MGAAWTANDCKKIDEIADDFETDEIADVFFRPAPTSSSLPSCGYPMCNSNDPDGLPAAASCTQVLMSNQSDPLMPCGDWNAAVGNEDLDRSLAALFDDSPFTREEDEALAIHCVARDVASHKGITHVLATASEASEYDFHFYDEKEVMPQHYAGGDTIEFFARATLATVSSSAITVSFNDGRLLTTKPLTLATSYQMFYFRSPPNEPVWSVQIHWDLLPGSDDAGEGHVMQLDAGFGLRVRGEDILQSIRIGSDSAWRQRGGMSANVHDIKARVGHLQVFPGRYVAETAIEFVAHGLTGKETIDVYINGLTVICALDVRLDGGQKMSRLLRYCIAPVSVVIRSVLIRLRKNQIETPNSGDMMGSMTRFCAAAPEAARAIRLPPEKQPARPRSSGVIIDSSFGVVVTGYDCLSTAMLVDPLSKSSNPLGWSDDCEEKQQVRSGQWLWDGYYFMRPYRRSTKPYELELAV